jgi:hypothetical protein
MAEFYEECWFIYGIRIGEFFLGFLKYHSKGDAGSVEFNWLKALNRFQIGWYHSHPGKKFLIPSDRDRRTMRSWILGKGKPLLCGIFCDGEQRCYLYQRTGRDKKKNSIVEKSPVVAKIIGPFFIGWALALGTFRFDCIE